MKYFIILLVFTLSACGATDTKQSLDQRLVSFACDLLLRDAVEKKGVSDLEAVNVIERMGAEIEDVDGIKPLNGTETGEYDTSNASAESESETCVKETLK